MRIQIHHITRYRYPEKIQLQDHLLFLRPLESNILSVKNFSVTSNPQSSQRWVRDAYSNILLVCAFEPGETDQMEFIVDIEVESVERNPFDFVLEPYAVSYPFTYNGRERVPLAPAIHTVVPGGDRVIDWFYDHVPNPGSHESVLAFLTELVEAIHTSIRYQRRDEEGIQTPATTISLGSGSCRDMALLFIAICRQLGLAARFVSGYLYDGGDNGGHHNRARGSTHAWAEIYLPGAGWKGFDPTNGIMADAYFIPTAVAIEPETISPIQGHYTGRAGVMAAMEVELDIVRV